MNDYYDDLLIEPIEHIECVQKMITQPSHQKNKCPDLFRPYPINVITSNTIDEDTATINDGFVETLYNMANDYDDTKHYSMTKYLTEDDAEIDSVSLEYYNLVYDIADIIIVSDINHIYLTKKILKKLLDTGDMTGKHIRLRLIMYMSYYLVLQNYQKFSFQKYIKAVIDKLVEYQNNSTILNYFTQKEIKDYICVFKKMAKS